MILDRVLRSLIKKGDLTVTDWNGKTTRYGDGGVPKSHMVLKSAAVAIGIAMDPDLRLGEAYTDGQLTLKQGTIRDLIALAMQNVGSGQTAHPLHRLGYYARLGLRRLHQRNPIDRKSVV